MTMRYNSWHSSLPSRTKQQREMTKFCDTGRTWTTTTIFLKFPFQIYCCVPDVVYSFDSDKQNGKNEQ